MCNAIACHPLTNAQSLLEQQPTSPANCLPVLLFSMMLYDMEYSFGHLGSSVVAVSLPASCAHPASSLAA